MHEVASILVPIRADLLNEAVMDVNTLLPLEVNVIMDYVGHRAVLFPYH